MTVRSWDHLGYLGTSSPGFPRPAFRDAYAQNGSNRTAAEKAAGTYLDHPYSMTRSRYTKPGIKVKFGTSTFDTSTDSCGAQPAYATVPTPNVNEVMSNLLEKWRNSSFDIGVTIGEGREAVSMMVQRLSQIASAARFVKRGNISAAIGALGGAKGRGGAREALYEIRSGNLANAWLELQYGWKPLLNDIYSASDHVKFKGRTGVIRSSVKETRLSVTGTGSYPPGDAVCIKNERSRHLKVVVGNIPDEIERLGLSDPFNVIWNLTGFSFVVDWFLPIGDYLQAIHAKQVMKVISCCDTSVYQAVSRLPVHGGKTYGSWTAVSGGSAYFNHISMSRVVSGALPPAWGIVEQVPALLEPTWDPSLLRLANATALVRARLGSLR